MAAETLKQQILHLDETVNPLYKGTTAAPTGTPQSSPNASPAEVASTFLASLQSRFDADDAAGIAKHFRDDGYWRDILTIDSGDWNAFKGPETIGQALKKFGVPKIRNLTVIKANLCFLQSHLRVVLTLRALLQPLDAAIVPVNENVSRLHLRRAPSPPAHFEPSSPLTGHLAPSLHHLRDREDPRQRIRPPARVLARRQRLEGLHVLHRYVGGQGSRRVRLQPSSSRRRARRALVRAQLVGQEEGEGQV